MPLPPHQPFAILGEREGLSAVSLATGQNWQSAFSSWALCFDETTQGFTTRRLFASAFRRMHGITRFTLFLELSQRRGDNRCFWVVCVCVCALPFCFCFFPPREKLDAPGCFKKLRVLLEQNVRCSTFKREPDAGADGLTAVWTPETVSLQEPLRLGGSRRVKEGFKGTFAGVGRARLRPLGLRLRHWHAEGQLQVRVETSGLQRPAGLLHSAAAYEERRLLHWE